MKFVNLYSYFLNYACLFSLISFVRCGFFDSLTAATYCKFFECCNDEYIHTNLKDLAMFLNRKVYGQHIVQKDLLYALKAHYEKNHTYKKKPLVLSFHGTPGTGKTMVANAIVESIYKEGHKSSFVKSYNSRISFPLASETDKYNVKINEDIKYAIGKCPRSMFIFNEVHKMPVGIFESLSAWVDYGFRDMDLSQAVFILISNTAGVEISDHLGHLIKSGTTREDTTLKDFEETIRRAAYNVEGGLKKSALIKSHVVDHFIPFLPLEIAHVRDCIKAEFERWGRTSNRGQEDAIIKSSVSLDSTHAYFSIFGCKGIEKSVALEVQKNARGIERSEL